MSDQKTEQKTLKPSDFNVGQKIIFVGNKSRGHTSDPVEMTVYKTGRKWVHASRSGQDDWGAQRFAPPNMCADGEEYMSPGTFVLDLATWEAEKLADEAWRVFRTRTQYMARPDHLTAEAINEIIARIKGGPRHD